MEEKYELGSLEFAFKLINRKTGEEKVVVSTPSMWARMTEFKDRMTVEAKHSNAYILERYINGMVLLAAAAAGVWPKPAKGIPSFYEEAAFVNEWDAIDVTNEYRTSKEAEAREDPFASDQEEGQEAQ